MRISQVRKIGGKERFLKFLAKRRSIKGDQIMTESKYTVQDLEDRMDRLEKVIKTLLEKNWNIIRTMIPDNDSESKEPPIPNTETIHNILNNLLKSDLFKKQIQTLESKNKKEKIMNNNKEKEENYNSHFESMKKFIKPNPNYKSHTCNCKGSCKSKENIDLEQTITQAIDYINENNLGKLVISGLISFSLGSLFGSLITKNDK